MSANRIETSRRSAVAADAAVMGAASCRAAACGAPTPIGVAHSEQNLAPGGFGAPQLGHAAANGLAHSVQNLAPTRFSVPQLEQITCRVVSGVVEVRR